MTPHDWHAGTDLLTTFARAPRALDDTTAASVEAHLAACAPCRQVVASAADPSVVAGSWEALERRIDRPRQSFVERILAAVLPDGWARVVAATPTLQAAWMGAMVAVALAAVAVAHQVGSDSAFLVVAPLCPLAGVALVFAPTAEPAGEAGVATPVYGAGLVLVRTLSVVATTLPVLLVASALLPAVSLSAVAWLLPSLGLLAAAMALSTWWTPLASVVAAAGAWAMGVALVAHFDGSPAAIASSAVFAAPAQLLFATLVVAAAALATARRDQFTALEAR